MVTMVAVARRVVCETYDYSNDTLGRRGLLWHCGGSVMFQGYGECTEWHGTFRHNHGGLGNIHIRFNYRGVRPYHSAFLLPIADGRWTGRDYAARRITLTRLGRFSWDEYTETWDPLPLAVDLD